MSTYKILPSFPQGSSEWHEARTHGIGASDVAPILGLSKWSTPLAVWHEKRGVPNEIDPHLAYFGHALEPVIAQWIRDEHPEVGPVTDGIAVRSLEWPWLNASPDRMAGGAPVELKTSSAYSKADWTDGIPLAYQAQVQTQIAVLGASHGWLAVLHGGNSPELYRVPRDDQFIREQLVPKTRTFWEEHVLACVPPEPVTSVEAAALWPGNPDEWIDGSEDLYELWSEYGRQQAIAVEANQTVDTMKLELQKALKDATELRYEGKTLFTWKPRKGATRLDTSALKSEMPDVASKYMRAGEPTRTFVRKTIKETGL